MAEQLSARIESHTTQVAPPAPHVANARVSQTSPSQQPLGHDVWSQMQSPDTQRRPAPHAGALPQRQAPPEQDSALVASHVAHTPPPAPQALSDGALQIVPAQQPPEHDVASQTQLPFRQR